MAPPDPLRRRRRPRRLRSSSTSTRAWTRHPQLHGGAGARRAATSSSPSRSCPAIRSSVFVARPRARRCSRSCSASPSCFRQGRRRPQGQAARQQRPGPGSASGSTSARAARSTATPSAWFDPTGRVAGRSNCQPTNPQRRSSGPTGRDVFVLKTRSACWAAYICFEHSMDLNRYALIALGQQVHVAGLAGDLSGDDRRPELAHFDNLATAIKYHALAAPAYVICAQSRIDEGAIDAIGLTGQPDKVRGGRRPVGHRRARRDLRLRAAPRRPTRGSAVTAEDRTSGSSPLRRSSTQAVPAGHYARPDVFSFGIDGRAQTPIRARPRGAVDHWHVIGTPDNTRRRSSRHGDTPSRRCFAPPNAG